MLQWPLVESVSVVGYYTRCIQYCSSWRRSCFCGWQLICRHTDRSLLWNILHRERISHLGHCSWLINEIVSWFWPRFQKPASGVYRAPQAQVCPKGRKDPSDCSGEPPFWIKLLFTPGPEPTGVHPGSAPWLVRSIALIVTVAASMKEEKKL